MAAGQRQRAPAKRKAKKLIYFVIPSHVRSQSQSPDRSNEDG